MNKPPEQKTRDHIDKLMSVRDNSPYQDQITEDGTVLIYEGHDVPKSNVVKDPKKVGQPKCKNSGSPTENEKF